jgi:hypothetical protein
MKDETSKISRNVGIENLNKRICLKRMVNIMISFKKENQLEI